MPHLIVEYSANLEDDLNLDGLMLALRDCAVASGVFPLGGIRVRGGGELKPVDITTQPHPGFPTDMQAQFSP